MFEVLEDSAPEIVRDAVERVRALYAVERQGRNAIVEQKLYAEKRLRMKTSHSGLMYANTPWSGAYLVPRRIKGQRSIRLAAP